MVSVRFVITSPFRAIWFLITLPFLILVWILYLLKRAVLAIVSVPVYYLGRLRERAAIAWDWTRQRTRARLALPWWGRGNVKATQSTQTLEDEDDDQYSTPSLFPSGQLDLLALQQAHPPLNPELISKLQKLARKRSTSQAQRQFITTLLTLYLQQVSSPVESEREEEDSASAQPYPVVRDEKSLRLILDLMSLSNSQGDGDKHAEVQRQRAREIASAYQYDSGKLQELISELDRVSFEMDTRKKSKRGKESSSHRSHVRQRHSRLSPSRRTRPKRSPQPRPPSESDSDSLSEACVTAEDRLSEDDVNTSEYHSPPEEPSDSEEEVGEGAQGNSLPSSREKVRKKSQKDSTKASKPSPDQSTNPAGSSSEERTRSGSERHCSFTSGILSPVLESPEYARTPSSEGSADELHNDLKKALSQLDSETSGLQADAKEVELIEQTAARRSEGSESTSPFPSATPTTPNTVVWEKGTCVVLSSTPEPKRKENEEGERSEVKKEEEDEASQTEEATGVASESGEFAAIPKVAPSLGLKEGHDRQQLAVARSSTRRRPPSRHSAMQNESSSPKADPEMEHLEKQVQQSVDTLSTLLVEHEKKAGGTGGAGDEKIDEDGEGGGGEVEDDEDSSSDEEDNQEDGAYSRRKPPGSVQVLPSISDQMRLLSPGSVQPVARELSPETLLEESLYSISKPIPVASSVSKTAQVNDDTQPTTASTSSGRISSTTSSPGPDTRQVETPPRPRSRSLDTHRERTPRSSKPLMIPSAAPPWIEMRKNPVTPLQPLPPRAPTLTPPQPTPESRSRASSDPPTMDPVYDVLQRQDLGAMEAVDQDQVYDCLQPKDDRIYELTPIKYLHQTVRSSSASPLMPPKSHSSRHSQDEGSKREERKRRSSSSEKTHSSRHSHESRSSKERERERERERGKERDSERGRERGRERRERERERGKDKERRHHSNSPERDSHRSKHSSSKDSRSSEKRHHSSSHEHDKPSRSKESSRKHTSKSSSKEGSESSSKRRSSSSSKEKEKEEDKGKTSRFSLFKGKQDSGKSSKSEKEKSSRSSEKGSRHRDEEDSERGLSRHHRSSSRLSVASTSAISSSPTHSNPDTLKKTTSLSSLSTSGSSQ